MTAIPLLEQLRLSTRTYHRQVDHHPLMRALLERPVTIDAYRQALQALRAPVAIAEQVSNDWWLGRNPPTALLSPTRLIDQDLEVFGGNAPILMGTAPTADTLSAQIGIRYIIEGARLGATVIGKHLDRYLDETEPRHYFSEHGHRDGWHWFVEQFVDCLPELDEVQVLQAAIATYQCFLQHFAALSAVKMPTNQATATGA